MDNRSKLDNQFAKSKKPFSESKKPCSPPFQIKNELRRLNMNNFFFQEKVPRDVCVPMFGQLFDEHLTRRGSM